MLAGICCSDDHFSVQKVRRGDENYVNRRIADDIVPVCGCGLVAVAVTDAFSGLDVLVGNDYKMGDVLAVGFADGVLSLHVEL